MYQTIKTPEDVREFLEKTNSLHDGYILSVQYSHNGITASENRVDFEPDKTKLTLQILVTSIWNAMVEIEFEDLYKWQIKGAEGDIFHTSVTFDQNRWIVWADDAFVDMEQIKHGSYVIARSMKWRITEQNKF